ncbi:hypothetical protein ACXZ65_40200, partial [Streptomyces aculeolatus]
VVKLDIDSSTYYLDASQPWEGFGHLPQYCYNGHARVVNPDSPQPVYFEADSLREKSMTTVFFSNEAGKGLLSGRVVSTK